MSQTYTFYVQGMHCQSCVLLTQHELQDVPGVTRAKTSLQHARIEVTGEFGTLSAQAILDTLNQALQPHGYTLSYTPFVTRAAWSEFLYATPIAAACIALFILLQKAGIVNLVNASEVTYGTAFVVGLIASVSTCMAVVGGVVLSLSASFAKAGDTVRPQMIFHIGRLVSFFVLGGAIGALGSIFRLGATGTLVLGVIVACVLFALGLNLLDIVPWARKLSLTAPTGIWKKLDSLKGAHHVFTPLIVGVATFFLPCGFTQSMQAYTLTTGNFVTGGLTMLAFALGTLPVLALLSFSSVNIQSKATSGVFFKAVGMIVLFFAVFNFINALAGAGIIPPVFIF